MGELADATDLKSGQVSATGGGEVEVAAVRPSDHRTGGGPISGRSTRSVIACALAVVPSACRVTPSVSLSGMTRRCARPGCNLAASATLCYHYAERTVWLEPLLVEAHPANHDLCANHANRLSPPKGWRLEDRRSSARAGVV